MYDRTTSDSAAFKLPPPTNGLNETLRGIWRMFTYYPYWFVTVNRRSEWHPLCTLTAKSRDISYLVAVIFTLGSVVWCINALFCFLPYTNPASKFPGEILYGGGITAFIGTVIFEVGSVLLMLEAVNENRVGCFGWAVEQVYDDHFESSSGRGVTYVLPGLRNCIHHHNKKSNMAEQPSAHPRKRSADTSTSTDTIFDCKKSWIWFPTWAELRSHYLYDLGFLACLSLTLGVTVFLIAAITALPAIYTTLNTPAKLNGLYWIPQIIGGIGFVVSGALFTLETQKYWWLPAPGTLGWHVGVWNLIGGVGFLMCPILGLYAGHSHKAAYQANCSTFWG